MGQMHVIRSVCMTLPNLSVVSVDFDDARLESLEHKARPFAQSNNVELRMVNPKHTPIDEKFSYIALMAPILAGITGFVLISDLYGWVMSLI